MTEVIRLRARRFLASTWLLLALSPVLGARIAEAQDDGCRLLPQSDSGPPRKVLMCRDGLTITVEGDAGFALTGRSRDGNPQDATLRSKAILIDLPPKRRNFQVRTPHAIATVRGTVWAVDVSADQTSVFVRSGQVTVRSPSAGRVTLAAGDGVDVRPGTRLKVTRWGAARVVALLARFGQ